MPLTDASIRQAKPLDTDYWLSDKRGLRLLVKPNGAKYWRLKYRHDGKQKTLALGVYPDVGLAAARAGVENAKALLRDGIDPGLTRKKKRKQGLVDDPTLFCFIAREWWEHQKGTWTPDHAHRIWSRLESDALPHIGQIPITAITSQQIIALVRCVEARGALDVARRLLQDVRRVCVYAAPIYKLASNPASDLVGTLKARKQEHRASLPREELPGFLQALESYSEQGRLLTQLAIKLLVLTFVRSGELRGARWEEFNLKEKLWRIPAHRMKMKTEHLVPLSRQSIELLKHLHTITGEYELVFPSERRRCEPMSDNTMRRAIFKLGYDGNTIGKSKAVPHGFRATACSILNETGFNPDAIERQLAHMERNGVRAAYTHHARYMEDRRKMLQWWGDYLDELRLRGVDGNVVAGKFGGETRPVAPK